MLLIEEIQRITRQEQDNRLPEYIKYVLRLVATAANEGADSVEVIGHLPWGADLSARLLRTSPEMEGFHIQLKYGSPENKLRLFWGAEPKRKGNIPVKADY